LFSNSDVFVLRLRTSEQFEKKLVPGSQDIVGGRTTAFQWMKWSYSDHHPAVLVARASYLQAHFNVNARDCEEQDDDNDDDDNDVYDEHDFIHF
jgi:hypothetical protein